MKQDELTTYYHQHYSSLFLFALSLTGKRSDAEDLVANAFLKAILSFTSGNFHAWMYKVIRNEFINNYKKGKKVFYEEDASIDLPSGEDVLSDYIQKEEKRWLYRQIFLLPLKERHIMILSSFHDVNDHDIANIMNLSVSNVRVLKHRTRQKLLKLYKEVWE